jgi:cytochrome P450
MVQKGQQVMFCIYGMHRRKDLYGPDANEFKPERWENRRQSGDFLPFNSGARSCLGRKYFPTSMEYLEAEKSINLIQKHLLWLRHHTF